MLTAMLMMAAATPQTAVEVERAFAADAQKLGQWTAFRKWSTDDATMFVPQPANAHEFLKDRKDPAKAIDWWPTASYISCDGSLAVNTGSWKRPDGAVGYFTTVWQRQKSGGWKWVLDSGDVLNKPRARPATPVVLIAACRRPFRLSELTVYDPGSEPMTGEIYSKDGTVRVRWSVFTKLDRTVEVALARRSKLGKFKLAVYLLPVMTDRIAAPK